MKQPRGPRVVYACVDQPVDWKAFPAFDTRKKAETRRRENDRIWPERAPHEVVKFVRWTSTYVTVVRLARERHSVRVNGVEIFATTSYARANRAARDLRRALRKGGG